MRCDAFKGPYIQPAQAIGHTLVKINVRGIAGYPDGIDRCSKIPARLQGVDDLFRGLKQGKCIDGVLFHKVGGSPGPYGAVTLQPVYDDMLASGQAEKQAETKCNDDTRHACAL